VKKLAQALWNVINKDKKYVEHSLVTHFMVKVCKIDKSHVLADYNNGKEDKEEK
jgi:hypothetical protein